MKKPRSISHLQLPTPKGGKLQPYPYVDPDRILVLGAQNQKAGDEAGLSYLDMRDWKEASSAFATIAASSARVVAVSDGRGDPERLLASAISKDLFPLLGVSPILGRWFSKADDQPNAPGVVLLSHTTWSTRYQSDPNITGRSILLNGRPHTVVGVMPPRLPSLRTSACGSRSRRLNPRRGVACATCSHSAASNKA